MCSDDENEAVQPTDTKPPIERVFLDELSSGRLAGAHIHLGSVHGAGEVKGDNKHIGWIFAMSGVILAAVFGGVTLGTWYNDSSIDNKVEKASLEFNKSSQTKFELMGQRTEIVEEEIIGMNEKISAIMTFINK